MEAMSPPGCENQIDASPPGPCLQTCSVPADSSGSFNDLAEDGVGHGAILVFQPGF